MFVFFFWLEIFEVILILFMDFVGLLVINLIFFIYIMINVVGNYFYVVMIDIFYKRVEKFSEGCDGDFYC